MKTSGKPLFYLLFFILFFTNLGRGQGLIFDPMGFDTLPIYSGEKGQQNLPPQYSLRKYCPIPADQGDINACVAFACSYGFFTIYQAHKKKGSSQKAYSAAYMFKQIGQEKGMSIKAAFNFMMQEGNCPDSIFSNQNLFKNIRPTSREREFAQKNIMKGMKPLLYITDTSRIKMQLRDNYPVVLGLIMEKGFRKRPFPDGIWKPNLFDLGEDGHAMLIVGYDDNSRTFDIMNSYGTGWGVKGFIRLRYDDLKILQEKADAKAYSFTPLSKGMGNEADKEPHLIDSTERTNMGRFALKHFKNSLKTSDGRDSFIFEPIAVKFNPAKRQYETERPIWSVNDLFQLWADDIPSGKFLYVFSLDAIDSLAIHWQPDARTKSPVPSLIKIPTPDNGLQLEHAGEDRLVVLIADRQITDFKARLDQFIATNGDVPNRLQKAFGDVLMPENLQHHEIDEMRVSRFVYEAKGWVLPMILTIKAE